KPFSAYRRTLLKSSQPIILPGLVGLWLVLRRPGLLRSRAAILAAWIIVPVALYSLSSFRTPRFIFPILPALALCAGYALVTLVPRFASFLGTALVPATAVVVALLLWWRPSLLTRDPNAAFKRSGPEIRELVPAGESVPYLGNHYWAAANPLLYYAERPLAASSATGDQAIRDARAHPSRLLLVTRPRLPEVINQGVPYRVVVEGPGWALLQLTEG